MTISSFFVSFLVMGIGLGLVMSQLVNLTLSNVQAEDTAEASGVNNALGDLGNAFGTAVIGSLLLSFFISGTVSDIARTADLELSVQERNQLIAELGDNDDLETEEGQQKLLSELPEDVRDDMPRIFDDNASAAMKDTLMVILLIILLTMLVATFLPAQMESSKKAGVEV